MHCTCILLHVPKGKGWFAYAHMQGFLCTCSAVLDCECFSNDLTFEGKYIFLDYISNYFWAVSIQYLVNNGMYYESIIEQKYQ